jgi:GSH-dependent disulfide-bond oxidoreductase
MMNFSRDEGGREMELYTAGTGNGQRAVIAVNECGVSCKIHVLNLGQGHQKAADYLKINPTARIPTPIDSEGPGGKPLAVTQSWAILMYLCEKTGKFLPADPVARVRMFQWMAEGAADYASVSPRSVFELHTLLHPGPRTIST